jgi:hypothetical protein
MRGLGVPMGWGWLLMLGALLGAATTAGAAPPWQRMVLFKKVEADPNKDYRLTEDNGPWLILAVTFSGDHAWEQARELVYVLRSEYKLPAYMHQMNFDFTEGTLGRGVDRFGESKRMRYRVNKEIVEIGVLVGDFPSVDDPEARRVLQTIKYTNPKCLDPEEIHKEGQTISRPLVKLRSLQQAPWGMPF